MITLAIESSTDHGSIAALQDNNLIFSEQFVADRSHSSELFTSLERFLKIAQTVDQIIIGLGPGSYSGVRIAIAAAIGLQLGKRSRLLGIASVAAMDTVETRYQVIGDARRNTFYYAQIRDGECVEGPLLLTEYAVREKIGINASLPFFSSAPIGSIPGLQITYPSAENLARLGAQGRGIHCSDNLEPIYLRDPHITHAKNQ